MASEIDLSSLLAYHCLHIDLAQLTQIEQVFGSFAAGLKASDAQWQQENILKPSQQKQFFGAARQQCLQARDQALEWGSMPEQHWLSYQDPRYPESLLSIDKPPPVLGVRGDVDWLSQPQISVVGSRNASQSAVAIAKDFAHFLADQGITVTSGLALGIDSAAHQGGLLGPGKTIAVVATGLDRIYPAANQTLGRQIAEHGAMVSEFPLGTKPLAFQFPMRNRIISGLSLGTLVVEAALKSGSLITARTAMEQGREVFAVPGSIHNPQAKGCHQLIKQGAKLVESGQDIFEELIDRLPFELSAQTFGKGAKVESRSSVADAKPTSKLLQWIEFEPIGLDELAVISKMPVSQIQAELLMLELNGSVEKLSAGRWRKVS